MGNYSVYKHTTPNGKVYIGITCQPVIKRWGLRGQNYSGSKLFWKAIQKYGWNNIAHEILSEGLSKSDAEAEEIRLIEEFRSNEEEFGYNITSGGGGASGYKQTPEHIAKRMANHAEKIRGRRHSPERIEQLRRQNKGEGNPFYGKHHTEENKAKFRDAMTPEMIEKLNEAKRSPESRQKLRDRMLGMPQEFFDEMGRKHRKPVAQCDVETGAVIAVFDSARQAQEVSGVRCQDISACIHGRQKTAKGYKWRFATEEEISCMI